MPTPALGPAIAVFACAAWCWRNKHNHFSIREDKHIDRPEPTDIMNAIIWAERMGAIERDEPKRLPMF